MPAKSFALHTFFIKKQRKPESREIIKRRGSNCPEQVPAKDLKKGRCEFRQHDQLFKIAKPDPVHQFRRNHASSIVRKRDQDHKDDRQHIKDTYADHRKRQHENIKLPGSNSRMISF